MRANLSIYGLYNYDQSIFENFNVPELVDKDIVVENILLECAELECLYPNPDLMKMAIGNWSRKEMPVWDRMAKAMSLEYNPLENYDRMEKITDTETRDLKYDTETENNGTNTTERRGSDEDSVQVSAYDSSTYEPRDKTTTQYNSDYVVTDENNMTDNKTESGTITRVHDNRTHGNIGVTTSQQMLQSELDIAKFNIIDFIINSFKNRFCILVY